MWTLFEPIHAVTYFAPEARSAFEQAGLRGFWRGYFAGRAAPLGPAGAAVVTASFFTFAPAFVARAVPGIWELITPEEALRTRLTGAAEALRGLLAGLESEAAAAADLLWQAAGELDCSGRVLAAANAALGVPGAAGATGPSGPSGLSGPARLWQAATLLREHRGDGHFAALTAADIDGCEAVVLRSCLDLRREDLQPGQAGRPRLGQRRRYLDRRRPGCARRRRGCHRPRRGAALDSPRRRDHGRGREGPHSGGAGVRERPPLPQPYRRPRSRHHRLSLQISQVTASSVRAISGRHLES
jgi:hypothetical protein